MNLLIIGFQLSAHQKREWENSAPVDCEGLKCTVQWMTLNRIRTNHGKYADVVLNWEKSLLTLTGAQITNHPPNYRDLSEEANEANSLLQQMTQSII